MHRVRWFVLSLSLVCLVGCESSRQESEIGVATDEDPGIEDNPPNSGGKPFLDELAQAARKADRVVIVEHSYVHDNSDIDIHTKFLPERKYKEVALTGPAKETLASSVAAIDPYVSMYASACIYEPHHRFEFYRKSKRINTLEVCFSCAQLEWDGAKKTEPQAFYQGLSKFIETVGLQPERDWHALAKQASRP